MSQHYDEASREEFLKFLETIQMRYLRLRAILKHLLNAKIQRVGAVYVPETATENHFTSVISA